MSRTATCIANRDITVAGIIRTDTNATPCRVCRAGNKQNGIVLRDFSAITDKVMTMARHLALRQRVGA